MSASGDSGSLLTWLYYIAARLLFAGSSVATIINQIENVRSLLRVEVAALLLFIIGIIAVVRLFGLAVLAKRYLICLVRTAHVAVIFVNSMALRG